jgi:hypothetical protein
MKTLIPIFLFIILIRPEVFSQEKIIRISAGQLMEVLGKPLGCCPKISPEDKKNLLNSPLATHLSIASESLKINEANMILCRKDNAGAAIFSIIPAEIAETPYHKTLYIKKLEKGKYQLWKCRSIGNSDIDCEFSSTSNNNQLPVCNPQAINCKCKIWTGYMISNPESLKLITQ